MRGSCGGPLSSRLRLATVVDGVVQIETASWLRGEAVGDIGDEIWTACPMIEVRAARDSGLIAIYRRHRAGIQRVAEAYPDPTIGLLDAMETLASADAAADAADLEIEKKRLEG